MCKCLLLPHLLLLLCLASFTHIECDTNTDYKHVSVLLQKDEQSNNNDADPRQVTQAVTGQSRKIRQLQKRLLWTRKRSPSANNGKRSNVLDGPDMIDYLHTGLPSVKYNILTSPKNCCAGYSKTLAAAKDHRIRLVFLNVYLLPGSEIRIRQDDLKTEDIETNNPPYLRLVAESNTNVLHISIDEVGSVKDLDWQELPTFMAIYWQVSDSVGVWRRRPYTQCPVAQAAMYGGEVVLPASGLVSAADFLYDCVWTIRIPTTGWGVYIRVTEMDLPGYIEIRHGLAANSPLLATNGNETTVESLNQPEVGFWGRENGGIFIRVVKLIDIGYLTFVYGIAKLPENNECKFHYRGYFLMQGWNCENPSMCIPLNHTCNGAKNCPHGQDEDHTSCQPSRCKHSYEKQCWSGECVHAQLEFCPEDQCPRDRPFRCDWFHKCYSQIDKCNGIPYCDDGKDERGCPKTSKGLSTKTIVIIVCVSGLFTILPSIILCCWDDPVERDLQRAQEAFTNLCDLYSGRTLITQIQAARRAGTTEEARNTNHRPAYPGGTTNQEEVILLAPSDLTETQSTTANTLTTNSLIVPATETMSPRRPPRSLPNLTPPMSMRNDSDSTSPTPGSVGSRESQGSRGGRGSSVPLTENIMSPLEQTTTLSPPPYLLQPDVAALEHPVHPVDEDHDHEPPPYLSPPGGNTTADGLPKDTEAPPPYESVQHVSPPQPQPHVLLAQPLPANVAHQQAALQPSQQLPTTAPQTQALQPTLHPQQALHPPPQLAPQRLPIQLLQPQPLQPQPQSQRPLLQTSLTQTQPIPPLSQQPPPPQQQQQLSPLANTTISSASATESPPAYSH